MEGRIPTIKMTTSRDVIDKISDSSENTLFFVELSLLDKEHNHWGILFLTHCKELTEKGAILNECSKLEQALTQNSLSKMDIICNGDLLKGLVEEENTFFQGIKTVLDHPLITVSLPALIRKEDKLDLRLLGYKLDPHHFLGSEIQREYSLGKESQLFDSIKKDMATYSRLYSQGDWKKVKQYVSPFSYHIQLMVAVLSIPKPGSKVASIDHSQRPIQIQFSFTNAEQYKNSLSNCVEELINNREGVTEGWVSCRPSKVFNPHLFVHPPSKPKYLQYYCRGLYQYFHYGDQNFNDQGWGCAYRALQSILSWFRLQGRITTPVPSISEIQLMIDRINIGGDKLSGTNQWIGATEVSWVVTKLTGCNCRILHIADGASVLENCEMLRDHLERTGCPIMYGGDQYAYSIIGMNYSVKLYECEFLIMDPHYQGPDNLETMIARKGISWRTPKDMFKKGIFYNFCLPILPS